MRNLVEETVSCEVGLRLASVVKVERHGGVDADREVVVHVEGARVAAWGPQAVADRAQSAQRAAGLASCRLHLRCSGPR